MSREAKRVPKVVDTESEEPTQFSEALDFHVEPENYRGSVEVKNETVNALL